MIRYTIIIGVLAISLSIWAAGIGGVCRLPNAVLYDYCTRLSHGRVDSESRLLLIELGEDDLSGGDRTWMRLMKDLEALAPEKILFSFMPLYSTAAFYQKATEYGNVIFGRRVSLPENGFDAPVIEPIPDAAKGKSINYGYISVHPADYGVHRRQYTKIMIQGRVLPAFERAAVHGERLADDGTYRVNFIGGEAGLPKISLQRALSGDLLSAMVTSRHILIGVEKSPFEAGIHTPLSPEKGMSRLDFHGFALNTLLSDQMITDIPDRWALPLIAGVVVLVFLLSIFVSMGVLTWIAVPLSALVLALAWLLLSRFLIWIPTTELLAALLLTLIFIVRTRSVRQEHHIRNLLYQVSAKTKERLIPQSFYDSEEPWTYIMAMMDQTLNLTRSILLEPLRKDRRVKEIKALNCSIEDIHERRRDYRREPYNIAIRDNGMIRLDRRPFFKNASEAENQYLVPLAYAGRLLGFWAFGMLPEAEAAIPNFNAVISDFGGRIGELLYRREYRRDRGDSGRIKWRQYLSLSPPHAVDQDLNHALVLLERRLNLLDAAFDNSGNATVMYDHFGQILHINKPMNALLQKSGLTSYRTTATEFVTYMTPASPEDARQLLRQFLFERKTASMPARLPDAPNRHFMLHIRSLFLEDQRTLSEFAYPFHAYGIMMELNEVTYLTMFNQLKTELLRAIDHRLRTDLELIRCGAPLLRHPDLPDEKKERTAAALDRRIGELAAYLETAEQNLDNEDFLSPPLEHSIDPRQPFLAAIDAMKERAASRKIDIHANLPETAALACVDHETLTDVVQTILTLLIDDAVENTAIRIDMIETGEEFICNFSNSGFGMPNHVFRDYLFGETDVSSSEFIRVRSGAAEIEKGGGRLDGTSEMGVGFRFTIHLASRFCSPPSSFHLQHHPLTENLT